MFGTRPLVFRGLLQARAHDRALRTIRSALNFLSLTCKASVLPAVLSSESLSHAIKFTAGFFFLIWHTMYKVFSSFGCIDCYNPSSSASLPMIQGFLPFPTLFPYHTRFKILLIIDWSHVYLGFYLALT